MKKTGRIRVNILIMLGLLLKAVRTRAITGG